MRDIESVRQAKQASNFYAMAAKVLVGMCIAIFFIFVLFSGG